MYLEEHVSENRSYSKSSAFEAAKTQLHDSQLRKERTIKLMRNGDGFDEEAVEVVVVKRYYCDAQVVNDVGDHEAQVAVQKPRTACGSKCHVPSTSGNTMLL